MRAYCSQCDLFVGFSNGELFLARGQTVREADPDPGLFWVRLHRELSCSRLPGAPVRDDNGGDDG